MRNRKGKKEGRASTGSSGIGSTSTASSRTKTEQKGVKCTQPERLRLGLLPPASGRRLAGPMPMTEARGESAWVGWDGPPFGVACHPVCGDELGALEGRRRTSSGNSRALNQPQAMHLVTHLTPPHFPLPTPIHSPAGPAVGATGDPRKRRATHGGAGAGRRTWKSQWWRWIAERGRRQPEHQRQR